MIELDSISKYIGKITNCRANKKMVSKTQAQRIVEERYCGKQTFIANDDKLIILEELTLEKPWGWVFFYGSRLWNDTQDIRCAIAGNAPVIVERNGGKVISTGTAYPIEHYIDIYEREHFPLH